MAADFLAYQHVAKRRNLSHLYKATNQSAFFGADFIRHFRQKPVHARGNAKPRQKAAVVNNSEKRFSRGFSFPVPSLATLAVIAGTLIISLAALNWEGFGSVVPEKIALKPETASPMTKYADSGAISITPVLRTENPVIITEAIEPEPEITEIPLDLMPSFKWSEYKVQRGDSVSKIAADFGISMDAVITSNDIRNARRLREGETLRIPNMDGIPHKVKKGDSISGISKTYNVPKDVILDVNDIRSDIIKEGETLFIPGARMAPEALRLSLGDMFIYPVRKNISSNYGWRQDPFSGEQSFHSGLDLRGNTGTPIKAALEGTVSVLGTSRVYGKYIILSHYNSYQTLYAHLSAFSVKQWDRVIQGAKIGEMGSTGLSTGPHLHFSVFKNGKAVNPLDLLN